MKIFSNFKKHFRIRLVFKLILAVGITLLLSIATWAYFDIEYQKKKLLDHTIANADRLGNTVKLGTRYASEFWQAVSSEYTTIFPDELTTVDTSP